MRCTLFIGYVLANMFNTLNFLSSNSGTSYCTKHDTLEIKGSYDTCVCFAIYLLFYAIFLYECSLCCT